ncbi:hypothetical protein AJ80_09679 [Polytolypa hystricis UAMH7299]|uniref:Tyrosine specific protein phosphatases domain-containing protein n=1 Tax=Polytolypa hystricis (strain UAMH7299) TaxID=1447883 RepID=A0A2B7WLS9_POLH7|nr:hypothetical protein AJ80_09679 [Polytolypa hystricis UAMH7299]
MSAVPLHSSIPCSPAGDCSTTLTSYLASSYWDIIGRIFSDRGILRYLNTTAWHSYEVNEVDSTAERTVDLLTTRAALIMAGCGALSCGWLLYKIRRRQSERILRQESTALTNDAIPSDASSKEKSPPKGKIPSSQVAAYKRDGDDIDPGLLKKHSSYRSYTTSVATYPSIRTFFCPHPHIDKLPFEPAPLPLFVFIHGLGGSLAQFNPLLTTLTNVAPCFGIDLPGCGLSPFSPKNWDAYSIEALANLLAIAIEAHRDKERGQGVILIGHSLGCGLSALMASSASPVLSELRTHVLGFVAVCPPAGPPPQSQVKQFRRLLHIPTPIFDLWRRWDRRGGPDSASVSRFVGAGADVETRKLQLRFNEQSKTPVWRRMAWGTLPRYIGDAEAVGGLPGKSVWMGIHTPILLIAGESDPITKSTEVAKILEYFGGTLGNNSESIHTVNHMVADSTGRRLFGSVTSDDTLGDKTLCDDGSATSGELVTIDKALGEARRGIKAFIFPAPAAHALPYDRNTYRTLSGLIQDFVMKHVDERLSLGWQLQHLTTSGKWDVKNLAKWKGHQPVSKPIADTFVAMKTLREVDEQHTPIQFVQQWKGKIFAVIDISHESPVYDPSQLEKGGIQYHKLPTVSKIPPTQDEVRDFISLVNRLEEEISETMKGLPDDAPRPHLGVHCHYGFNRTGFFITSCLIEKKGFSVQGALDEFERCRYPGIRHAHFIDTLFVRYCVGLRRAPTL